MKSRAIVLMLAAGMVGGLPGAGGVAGSDVDAIAVTTSAGIILIDALWDYSVQDEVVGGLEKLGLDPRTIRYVLVSHGHADHAGGARHLQDRFGARVILSAADWALLERDTSPWPKPRRDLIATDGEKLTLGDTTLTLYTTRNWTAPPPSCRRSSDASPAIPIRTSSAPTA